MKIGAYKMAFIIAAVAIIFFAIGVFVGIYVIPAFINQSIDQFYFHAHKAQ